MNELLHLTCTECETEYGPTTPSRGGYIYCRTCGTRYERDDDAVSKAVNTQ